MKILVPGGLGFIGRNFLLHRPAGWQVVSLDLTVDRVFQKKIANCEFYQIDLTDQKAVERLARKVHGEFDACLFLAANGDPALSVPEPLWDLKMTTETLINVGQNFKIKKLVYLSSGAVYDGNVGLIGKQARVEPKLAYAISHQAAEEYSRFFQKTGKIKDYVIIRFFGAYGPYEPKRKIYSNLVKAFGIRKENEFLIRGDGKNLIDAMFVEDAVAGLVAVIKSKKTNLTVDFCKGDHPSINELVKIAAGVFGKKVKIVHQGQVPEYNDFYASNREFERLFGFHPSISLKEGLKKLEEHLKKA